MWGMTARFLDWLREARLKRVTYERLWIFLPIWLSLVIFLGVGPIVQQALSASLDAPAPSIYSAAFDEALIRPISLREWLFIGFDPSLSIAAAIASFLAATATSYRTAVVRAAIGATIAISVADAIILSEKGEAESILEAFLYNAIGFPFILIFLVNLLYLRYISKNKFQNVAKARWVFGVASSGISIVVSSSVWFLFQIFYNPAVVQFTTIASLPIEGYFAADEKGPAAEGARVEPFRALSILPHDSLVRKIQFTGIGGAGRDLKAVWRQTDKDAAYEIRVWPNYDCPYPQEISGIPSKRKPLVFEAKELEVVMPQGLSQFLGETDRPRKSNLVVPILAQYWVKSDDTKNPSSIEAFIAHDDKIVINPEDNYRFYFGGSLSKIDGKTARPARRELRFVIDGKPFVLMAGGSRSQGSDRLDCLPMSNVELREVDEETHIMVSDAENFSMAGALFEIRQKPLPTEVFRFEQSILTLQNANGWVEFSGFDFERMTDKYLGEGKGISISRNLKRIKIDGSEMEISVDDDLFVVGNFRARYDADRLEVDGEAKAIWINNIRMNPTIWERLDGWQLPLITALFGMIGLLSKWLLPRIFLFVNDMAGTALVQG